MSDKIFMFFDTNFIYGKKPQKSFFESLKEKHIISFLKVIIDNHRVNEIQSIFKEFHTLCNKHLGIE